MTNALESVAPTDTKPSALREHVVAQDVLSRAMHTLADGEQQDVNYISKPRDIGGASVQLPHPSADYHHIPPSRPHVPINRPYMLM